jgi:chromosome partitioning protein
VIVAVAHMKGGTGKTTTVAHLLAAFARRGDLVAGVDADTQGSLVAWADLAGEEFPTVEVAGSPTRVQQLARQLATTHEHVVIDTPNDPGRAQATVQAAIAAADVVLVPVAPSPLEFLRLSPTAEAIATARLERPQLRAAVLLSRVRSVTRSASEARAALTAAGWDVFDTEIPLREAITQSVGDTTPHDSYQFVVDELLGVPTFATRS